MGLEGGALNPNNVLCTDQAPLLAFGALNPGSALNPRTLNPGTTVHYRMDFQKESQALFFNVFAKTQPRKKLNFCPPCKNSKPFLSKNSR